MKQKKEHTRFFVLIVIFLGLSTMSSAHADINTLGTFQGSIADQQAGNLHQGFEAWLGRSEDYAMDYHPTDAPPIEQGGPWKNFDEPGWQVGPSGWGSTPYKDRLIISLPMMPSLYTLSVEEGATGAYNSHFANYAAKLVQYGYANMIIRLGWEFNGGWYKWSAGGREAAWVQFWRQIVTTMRSVPGAHFKFFWCPNAGESVNLDTVYPGNDYVDYIGFDMYDQSWATNTYPIPSGATDSEKLTRWTNAWQDNKTRQWGLDYFSRKATETGKPLAIGEWGATTRADGHGGGDNPYFIQWMHDWMQTNNVAFNLYFDANNPGDADVRLQIPEHAQAGAKYRELWGATSGGSSGSTHGGSRSLQGAFTSSASWINVYQYFGGIAANTTYTAQCWLKGQGKVQLKVLNAAWSPLAAQEFTATSAWTLVSINANSGNNSILIYSITDSGGAAGTLYLDDCSFGTGGSNILVNPGFETDGSWNGIDGTRFSIVSGTSSTSGAGAHSGTSVAQASVSSTPSYGNLYQGVGGLTSGSTHNVSLWLRGSGKITLKIMDASWTKILQSQQFTASSEWTQHSFTVVPTSSSAWFVLTDDGGAAGTLYIDDAFLGIGSNLLGNPGFESSTTSWGGFGDAIFTRTQP